MEELKFIVDEDNIRIDKFLADKIEGKSRSFIQGIINEGNILVNNTIVKSNYKVKINDVILVDLPEPMELQVKAENINIEILYEDRDVIVVNKEVGMVVHPAPGNYTGTLVNALLYHCKDLSGINGVIRPGIVHRIDKDTSGVLVIAKNDESHNKLASQLKDHSMKREYYALVEGIFSREEGMVDKPIGRHKKDRVKMAVVEDGKNAVTHYNVLESFNNVSLIRCKLETGRTHQIRVHMAFIGHPLVGDPVYGMKRQKFKCKGQLLHAKTLGFVHPTTNEYMEFSSELPDEFQDILNRLRNR